MIEVIKCARRLETPIDLNHTDVNDDSVLHVAMRGLNVKAVKYLLGKVDLMTSGWNGCTVLMKPFLDTTDEEVLRAYGDVIDDDIHTFSGRDSRSSSSVAQLEHQCVKCVLSYLARGNAVAEKRRRDGEEVEVEVEEEVKKPRKKRKRYY
jgi:hypothetical protein